jgi:outer membrane biosynthesis protein TonB
LLSNGLAQKAEQELPLVIAGKMPLYPIMARLARVEGVVKIRVTTDGEKVTSLEAESGPPMLVKFAKENILT